MIDLHMHTTYSDGTDGLPELLRGCESLKLDFIAITDHDTVRAYEELKDRAVRSLFGGKILPGVEITAVCCDNAIEILGYGINPETIAPHIKPLNAQQRRAHQGEQLAANIEKLGIVLPPEFKDRSYFDIYYYLVNNHRNFLDSFNPDFAKNRAVFLRVGLNNKKSPLAVNYNGFYVAADEAIKLIHAHGGLAFLAHPAQYYEHKDEIIENLKGKVDGIECFHYSASDEYSKTLVNFCKQNNLLISGGSDYHGTLHPEIHLGTGDGRLHLTREMFPLLQKVKFL